MNYFDNQNAVYGNTGYSSVTANVASTRKIGITHVAPQHPNTGWYEGKEKDDKIKMKIDELKKQQIKPREVISNQLYGNAGFCNMSQAVPEEVRFAQSGINTGNPMKIDISQDKEESIMLPVLGAITPEGILLNLVKRGSEITYLTLDSLRSGRKQIPEEKWQTARRIQKVLGINNIGDRAIFTFDISTECGEGIIMIVSEAAPNIPEQTILYKHGECGKRYIVVTTMNTTPENELITFEVHC